MDERLANLVGAAEAMVATAFGDTYGLTEADVIEAMRMAASALKEALDALKRGEVRS